MDTKDAINTTLLLHTTNTIPSDTKIPTDTIKIPPTIPSSNTSWRENPNRVDLLILQQQMLLLEVTLARLSLDILTFEWNLCLEINGVAGRSG